MANPDSSAGRNRVIVRTETGVEPYSLRHPIAKLLTLPASRAFLTPLLRGVPLETVVSEVYRAAIENPKIMECEPPSILMAVADAVRTGLEIQKTVFLVPLKDRKEDEKPKLRMWLGYKGTIELAIATGLVRNVDAEPWYARDRFEYTAGTSPQILHVPRIGPLRARGDLLGFYSVAWLGATRESHRKIAVLSLEEIEAVREKSREWNPRKVPDIPIWWGRKRSINVVLGALPKNPALRGLLGHIEREDALEFSDNVQTVEEAPAQIRDLPPIESLGESDFPPTLVESDLGGPPAWVTEPIAGEGGPASTLQHSADELVTMPFTKGDATVGTPLHAVSSEALAKAVNWAMRNESHRYSAFIEAASRVLDDREP
jgi:phage RecT family recombinase